MAQPKSIPHSRAFEIQEDMVAWLHSKQAFHHLYLGWSNAFHQMPNFASMPLEERAQGLKSGLPSIIAAETSALSGMTPTYCSSDYGTMLATMATVDPPAVLAASDVTAKEGVLIFETSVNAEASHGPVAAPLTGIRAISWHHFPGTANNWLIARLWTEAPGGWLSSRVEGRTKLFAGGMQISNLDNSTDRTFDCSLIRLLQSHFALLKSPLTVDEPTMRNPKVSPRTKRSLSDSIRRVYLRHPEHARYEADEAAAAREGRAPVRAHWVRGHWRNQPYPKTGEVKGIWIDGYIKGNPEHGTVSTRKLHVARASAAEVRGLVGAAA